MNLSHHIRLCSSALAMLLMLLACASCGSGGTFHVKGTVSGNANTNLYLKYYGNDAVQTVVTAANAGEFEAKGRTKGPSVVEILDNEYRVLGIFYATPGDKIEIAVNRSNPYANRIKGNEVNERLAGVLNSNSAMLMAGDSVKINNFVEQYIKAHPTDPVSSILYASLYDASVDPAHAAEVMESIDPEARIAAVLEPYALLGSTGSPVSGSVRSTVTEFKYRPLKGDSLRTFDPASRDVSLLAITDERNDRKTAIVPRLRQIYKAHPSSKLQILEFALFNDTVAWKSALRRDSAEWVEAWVPGGILGDGLDRLTIPTIPYYIVTDSKGTQKYRGTSIDDAEQAINRLTNK